MELHKVFLQFSLHIGVIEYTRYHGYVVWSYFNQSPLYLLSFQHLHTRIRMYFFKKKKHCYLSFIPKFSVNFFFRFSSASSSTFNLHTVNLQCMFSTSARLNLAEIPHSITTLIGLFILQIGLSYGFIGFYTLGLTYLDDNAVQHNVPALLGAAMAARYLGFVFGNLLSMFMRQVLLGWWLGWAIICPILLILAILIGLFPRRMIGTMVRQAADTIVETATNSSQLSLSRMKFLSDISYFSSLARLFRNKILLLNIAGTVFIQTAVINFIFYEQQYLQSRFLMPADESDVLNNEWTSRTLSKFIQPLFVSLAILIGGLVIAKATPSPR